MDPPSIPIAILIMVAAAGLAALAMVAVRRLARGPSVDQPLERRSRPVGSSHSARASGLLAVHHRGRRPHDHRRRAIPGGIAVSAFDFVARADPGCVSGGGTSALDGRT